MQNASISLNIYAICANILAGDTMNNVKIYNNLPDEAKKIRTDVFINEQGFNDEFEKLTAGVFIFCFLKITMQLQQAECLRMMTENPITSAELPF